MVKEAAEEVVPDLNWVRREIASLDTDLSKLAGQWEPPTARAVLYELWRVVTVLREIYPEADPYASPDAALSPSDGQKR